MKVGELFEQIPLIIFGPKFRELSFFQIFTGITDIKNAVTIFVHLDEGSLRFWLLRKYSDSKNLPALV